MPDEGRLLLRRDRHEEWRHDAVGGDQFQVLHLTIRKRILEHHMVQDEAFGG